MFKYLLLLAMLVSSLNVGAQVFKCKGADGKIRASPLG